MKKLPFLAFALIITSVVLMGAGCSGNNAPLTEEQQAAEHGMTLEEYKETKEAAARMNMTMEEHMKMMGDEEHDEEMEGMMDGEMMME